MWERIRQFARSPIFVDDQEKTRQAKLLNDVLVINFLATVVALGVALLTPNPPLIPLVIILTMLILLGLRQWMLHGKVRQASISMVVLFMGSVAAASITQGTVYLPVTGYYLLGIVISGLLLDGRAMLAVFIFSVLALSVLGYSESVGWLPPASPRNAARDFLTLLVMLANTGLFIYLSRTRYLDELHQRRQAEQTAQLNEERSHQLYFTAKRQAEELALLERVRLAIARELDLQTVIHTVIEAIADTFGYTLVSLYLLEDDQLINQYEVGYDTIIPIIPIDKGVSGRVVTTGKPVLLEDVQTDPAFLGAIEGIVSEVCVPLFDQGKVVGTLNVESTQGVKLTEEDLQLMTALSEHVSIAIGRARLYSAIQTNEQRYRTLAETAPDAIFILNRQGILLYANSTAENSIGMRSEQIPGMSFINLLKKYSLDFDGDTIESVFNTGQDLQTEARLAMNGKIRWYDIKLTPIRENTSEIVALLGIARDVTERKRTEEALEQHAQELTVLNKLGRRVSASLSLDQVIRSTLDEILPNLAPDLAFILVNQGDKLIPYGVTPKESPFSDSNMPIHQVGQCLCGLAASLKKPVYSIDIFSDSRCSWSECKQAGMHSLAALPLLSGDDLLGVLGLASISERDFQANANFLETLASQAAAGMQNALLHEQVQLYAQSLEERVRQRTDELEVKNRELETFSYSVSHDLKAPLRGIDGYSRLLLSDYGSQLDQEGQTFLQNIRSGVIRMTQLIDALLSYTHLERRSISPSQMKPRELLETIIAEELSEPIQKVVFNLELPDFQVLADRESLAQALRNLIDNAVKFSSQVPTPKIEIGGWENTESAVVWIRDNGIGFDMKYADRIFDIFDRLNRDEEYPGTGVGLALVRKAMERMGGRVWAESLPGQGATFYLEVPK